MTLIEEFMFFIINLCLCLFYCFKKIQTQNKIITNLLYRITVLENTIENVTT